jgi:phospholipid N-methyltransferase
MEMQTSFFYKFIVNPRKIGSITPSSAYLTQKMLAELPWENLHSIVELGAGTGIFTKYIANHKRQDCEALIIEQDPDMRHRLEFLYPKLSYGSQAENLPLLLKGHNIGNTDCIISGLPFAAFTSSLRKEILQAIYTSLKPGGIFVAFQYTPHLYLALHRQYKQVNLGFELRNLPPAFIYYCKK